MHTVVKDNTKMNNKDKKARSDQIQSEDLLGPIIENSRDIYYKFNLKNGNYEYLSDAATKLIGFTPKEIIDLGIEQARLRIHPDDRAKLGESIDKILNQIIDSDFVPTIEYRFLCKDEQYRWLSDNRTACYDENGVPVAVVGNVRDITESKKLQKQIAQSEHKYRQLFNNARVALFRSRADDGKVLECNQMLAEMFGYETCEQCIDDFISSKRFVDPDVRPKIMEHIYTHGYIEDFQTEVIRKDGSTFWASFSVRLLRQEGVLEGVAFDITNLKKLTTAEQKVLELVMKGFSNKQIASRTKRSVRTIEDHRASIMHKFEVHNLVELARVVLGEGLIE